MRAGALAAGLALGLLLAGCSSGSGPAPSGPATAGGTAPGAASGSGVASGSASSGTDGGSAPVVTVPGLEPASASGADGSDPGAQSGSTSATPGSVQRTVTVTATATPGRTGDAASSSATGTAATSSAGSGTAPGSKARTSTEAASTGRSTPSTPTSRSPAQPGGSAVTVDLSGCPGCTVIATHRGVAGSLSAALATNARGAVLLSVRGDGGIAGAINVPYGATFPTPTGKSLPCDDSGRCIVTGRQSGGHAILSAFHLGADGSWKDVSGDDGFPSATSTGLATDVDGDGMLDIAVQESAGDLTDWMVLTWSGGRFTVLGCAVASGPVPPASELSRDVCLS